MAWSWQSVADKLSLPEYIRLWNTRGKLLEGTFQEKQEDLRVLTLPRSVNRLGLQDASTAIQDTLDEAAEGGQGVVSLGPGTLSYGTGLSIQGGVSLLGMGGPADTDGGFATVPRTELKYTGSGVAMTLLGTATQGHKNIHLRDFLLRGTSGATGGLLVGTGTGASDYLNHSSVKRVTLHSFTNANAYGMKCRRCLTSVFEDVITRDCYDGFLFDSDSICTTLKFTNCHGYTSLRNALRMANPQLVTGIVFDLFVAESSAADGIYLDGARHVDFYSPYLEDNNISGGTAPITIVGTSQQAIHIHLRSPKVISGAVGGVRSFDIGNASRVLIHYPEIETITAGWARVTADTSLAQAFFTQDVDNSSVTDNASGRLQVLGSNSSLRYESGEWTPSDASGVGLSFSSVTATYERIGRQVTARAALSYPVTADTSNAVVGGLPFTVANSNDARQGYVSHTTEATLARAIPSPGGSTVAMATSVGAGITNATMSGDTVFFTVNYRV